MPRLSALKRSKSAGAQPRPPKDERFEKLLGSARKKILHWTFLALTPPSLLAAARFFGVVGSEVEGILVLFSIGISVSLAMLGLYQVHSALLDAYLYKLYSRLIEGGTAKQQVVAQAPAVATQAPFQSPPSPVLAPAFSTIQSQSRPVVVPKPVPVTQERRGPAASPAPPTTSLHSVPPPATPPPSPRCPACGRELPYGDLHIICPFCGARLK